MRFAWIAIIVLSVFSSPALACLCSCEGAAARAAEFQAEADEYEQVFSGLVISSERLGSPGLVDAHADWSAWTRSKVLVFHTWRGTQPAIAEVWTPWGTSCDRGVFAGVDFVAATHTKRGRVVADNSYCGCGAIAAATRGRGSYTQAGVAVLAATACVAALAFIGLWRLWRWRGSRQHLPFAACFIAALLPTALLIYFFAFQNVITAIASVIIVLLLSKLLVRSSVPGVWRRNAGWLMAALVGELIVAFVVARWGGEFASEGLLVSPVMWIFVAVEVVLALILLNVFEVLGVRRTGS